MKKILFAAVLVAGTTLGFAKDNVQNAKSTNIEAFKVENNAEKIQIIYQFNSIEEEQTFFEDCTSVIYAYQNTQVDDGNGGKRTEPILVSRSEETSPCIGGNTGITVYVIMV